MALIQVGIQGYSGGAIADQTLLLQDIRDGLVMYNTTEDPMIAMFTEPTIRQTLRVSQAPKQFARSADGGRAEDSKMLYRLLNVPFNDYDLMSEFTVKWIQDALSSDVINEVNGAIAGDTELCNSLFYQAIFLKQTVGSVGTPYQAGFYNGETDVPAFKNNNFSAAHFHYLGANSTTYTLGIHRAMIQDIREHGFGLTPGSLYAFFHTAQLADVQALINSNTTILQAITGQREKGIDSGAMNSGLLIEGVNIVFDDNVPSGYVAMLASDVKPLAKRVHFNAAYQGLQAFNPNGGVADYPLAGMAFMRRIGFAVKYLGAGTCRQLVGSTTYTNPTFRLG
jgi:hypothetical protein